MEVVTLTPSPELAERSEGEGGGPRHKLPALQSIRSGCSLPLQPIDQLSVDKNRSEALMPALKTKPTKVSVESHIAAIGNEEQKKDARSLVALMRKVTRQEPRMWGPSIVGFGSYHYKYPSGHEGDSALAAFAVRGRDLVVYIMEGFEGRDALFAKLGEHKTGKVCVYIRRLANIDLKVLEQLVARSVADTKSRYPRSR